MYSTRLRNTPLDRLLDRRIDARRRLVQAQVDAAMVALQAAGADVEIVGSMARGTLGLNSDVDFLILDRGSLSDTQIFTTVCDLLTAAEFDLIYADAMPAESLELMRWDARERP